MADKFFLLQSNRRCPSERLVVRVRVIRRLQSRNDKWRSNCFRTCALVPQQRPHCARHIALCDCARRKLIHPPAIMSHSILRRRRRRRRIAACACVACVHTTAAAAVRQRRRPDIAGRVRMCDYDDAARRLERETRVRVSQSERDDDGAGGGCIKRRVVSSTDKFNLPGNQ